MQPSGKRKPRAKAKPEIEPAKRIAGIKQPHAIISSSEASLERMEAEPNTVIRLSDKQAEQLRQIELAAAKREATRAADQPSR
jgi:hypothetical protein